MKKITEEQILTQYNRTHLLLVSI